MNANSSKQNMYNLNWYDKDKKLKAFHFKSILFKLVWSVLV